MSSLLASPDAFPTIYGQAKRHAERALQEADLKNNWTIAIYRPGPILSPWAEMLTWLRRESPARPFRIDLPHRIHFVYIEDIVHVICQTLSQKIAGIFDVGDQCPRTGNEVLELVGGWFNSSLPLCMPTWMLFVVASVAEIIGKLGHRTPRLTRDMIRGIISPQVGNAEQTYQILGIPLLYPDALLGVRQRFIEQWAINQYLA